ncbi:Fe-S protein assembly co-chaperone HscB [Sediminibacterium goheungense]|uniref:Co-chaperone protein HscB n=1 Tax=Sediminibacterium goheungense TaxID=1086393 RepID=A0A4R6IZW6_9BACT|nr:Fe-S protein assembly co-chaperone HscB [Sediminibacterium goheungense]TDO28011.1 co-chaperone protein HscB [Sediminibacterium goheungense]
MNHFELFNLPISLSIDTSGLSKQYFELQRKYHPDRFVQASAAEQEEALQVSAQVNKAFKTLKDPDATLQYVLQLKGLLEEEEKYQLSPDFLMEVMELNEEMEGGMTDAIQSKIDQLKKELYADVETIITNYQEGVTTEKELLQVKEYYFKKKYIDRMVDNLII